MFRIMVYNEFNIKPNRQIPAAAYREEKSMKTPYGKLAALTFLLLVGVLFLAPMRSGLEDYLYVYPQSLRMNMGDTYDITYRLESDHAQVITFASADERIAQVDQQGHVTALTSGQTQIRLTARDGARAAVNVEVIGTPVTALTLNTTSMDLEKGQVSGLRAIFNEGATDNRVEWRSADESVAKVDAVGRVSAVGGGSTYITAISPNGLTASATVNVRVMGDAVRITPDEITVGVGATLKLNTYYLPEDTTDTVSRWMTTNANVLQVDADGTLHAVGEGTAVISVFTQNGLSASTMVTVEQAAGIFEIAPSAVTIERGHTLSLEPRFTDEEGQVSDSYSQHYIAWSSSNPDVATVDENGLVTGVRSGLTRITAESDGMTAVCAVRVQVLVHEVTLNMDEVYLLRDETGSPIQLTASISPTDPDDPTITYSTNNAQVAQVDENGLVTMTGAYGTAVITAQAQSGAEAHFTVNVVTQLPEADTSTEPSVEPEQTPAESPAPAAE